MINKEKYLLLLKNQTAKKTSNTETNIVQVTDPQTIIEYENDSGQLVGVLDNQPYFDFRMDVFKNQNNGKCFRYCNVSYSQSGAAVLMVIRSNKEKFFLLNQQYRVFLNKVVYEIPRGFSDLSDMNAINTAIRELAEETGIDVRKDNYKLSNLGTVHPDSGLSNNVVSLFMVEIPIDECPELIVNDKEEPIIGHRIVAESELIDMIENDDITDAFTLAAFVKYKCRKEEK